MAWWVVLLEEHAPIGPLVGTANGTTSFSANLAVNAEASWSGGWWGVLMDEDSSGGLGLTATSTGTLHWGSATLDVTIGSLAASSSGTGRFTADLTTTAAPSTPWIDTGGPDGIPLYPVNLPVSTGRGTFTADLTNGHDVVLVATARGLTRGAPTNLNISAPATPAQLVLSHTTTTTIETSTREANTVTLSHFPLR